MSGDVKAVGAKADGITDDTAAIQRAIDKLSNTGGQVYLPPGKYLVAGTLHVPNGVAVVGANQAPMHIEPLTGTVILATGGRDHEDAPALFEMGSGSTVKGITVYYPEQLPEDIHPYPWTFHLMGGDNTVDTVTLINSYNGISVGGPKGCVRHRICNVFGCVLRRGIRVDHTGDIGRIENIQFHCHFWSHPATNGKWEPVLAYMWNNLEAFIFGMSDWQYVFNTFVYGAKIAYHFTVLDWGTCNGQFSGIAADATQHCIVVDKIRCMGLLITNGQFDSCGSTKKGPFPGCDGGDAPVQIIINPTCQHQVRFVNCAFWGRAKQNAILRGQSVVSFSDCFFGNSFSPEEEKPILPAVQVESGRVQINNCTFAGEWPAIHLGPEVKHAIITGNNGLHGVKIDNRAGERAIIANNETADK